MADSFRPFAGVAPRRYQQWFAEGERRSSSDGTKIVWGHAERSTAEPRVSLLERETIQAREASAALRAPGLGADESETVGDDGLTDVTNSTQ